MAILILFINILKDYSEQLSDKIFKSECNMLDTKLNESLMSFKQFCLVAEK
jgi:hypothetical protein